MLTCESVRLPLAVSMRATLILNLLINSSVPAAVDETATPRCSPPHLLLERDPFRQPESTVRDHAFEAGRAEMHPGNARECAAPAESAWPENALKRDDFSSLRHHALDYRSSLVFFRKPVSGSCARNPFLRPAWQALPPASAAPRPPRAPRWRGRPRPRRSPA